ncbi:hypothetical protein DIJ64_06725 [Mycobacterium leprae]|uniref:Guanylate cyclase domain-containing protein n=1 Tax=Mycobacterium leprae TaxID=1769 RepID=A0AAD0P6U4_MYCLR|nr:hypothetical protein [Mycobacterium leprae]AWV47872.1 hypothetical protein DIJ64_06725 [Mycobacterium leprae]OAR20543.1 hypothetical protein A8144_10515 [Mycobacterium leprae 3125609]OAX70755.1 hypothetical protein A3216_10130 [Mycobacterium leprae 7935681]
MRLRDEGSYVGSIVNRTARLRNLAHGGQTLLLSATENLMVARLFSGAWLTHLGYSPDAWSAPA